MSAASGGEQRGDPPTAHTAAASTAVQGAGSFSDLLLEKQLSLEMRGDKVTKVKTEKTTKDRTVRISCRGAGLRKR